MPSNDAPSTASGAGLRETIPDHRPLHEDGRTMSGENVLGMRVAGWRWKTPIPVELRGSEYGWSYASHWSTPREGDPTVERLFSEADVRRALSASRTSASTGWEDITFAEVAHEMRAASTMPSPRTVDAVNAIAHRRLAGEQATGGAEQGVYIASKTRHAAKWLALRAAGAPINSTWIDEASTGATADFADLWRRCIAEASSCAALILYHEDGDVLRGALVEAGAALASDRPVFLVSPVASGDTGPLGSFMAHRLVTRCETVENAISAARRVEPAAPAPGGGGEAWDAGEVWEMLFGALEGDVPDEMDDAACAKVAKWFNERSRAPDAPAKPGQGGEGALREALEKLERAATSVHSRGATLGPQWVGLSVALIQARAAFAPAPPSPADGAPEVEG